ncbi:MAG: hypothetical protein JKX80_02060 [Candidatus Pacebacteria bacterium]|nr:hypothetical protein [Candidatus Paceibacterota bacterium]
MNLFEYQLWQKTKTWLWIIIPLILVFLFIQPYISLFLLFVVFGRFLYVKWLQSALDKSAEASEEAFHKNLDGLVEDMKSKMAIAKTEEELKIIEDFPDVHLDFVEEKNEYLVTYRNEIAHLKSFQEIRQWLGTKSN